MKILTKFIFLCLIVAGLSSCAAALVGGGAAGGYYAEKNKKAIGQYSGDALITSKVKAKYLKDLTLRSFAISVSTNQHVVSLVGDVPNHKIRQRAINIALHTKDVKGVDARNLTVSAVGHKHSVAKKSGKKVTTQQKPEAAKKATA